VDRQILDRPRYTLRVGKKLEWDPEKLKACNCPEADRFIQPPYLEGWSQ